MTTEAQALADILAWSANSSTPDWQRDALRRLATQAALEPAEIDELASICKGDNPAVPLEAGHLRGPSRDQGEVYLRQMHGVRHVNALAPDQRLTLHRVGLAIIYGDNGSGKSGYARILKKVCRARMPGRAEEIAPDIYDVAPGTPSATIEYAISGQNRTCAWQLGQAADTALSGISVFDSRTANVHVDDTNDVAYTPFPLKLLGALAQLCKSVKDKLAAEIAQIKAQTPEAIRTPACSRDTAVGRLMARLTANTAPATVEALATLTQAEQDRWAQLTADLAGDPARAARQLVALKTKVDGHVAGLDRLFVSISDDTANNLRRLAVDSDAARRAAEAASSALFRDEPLPQIGSEVWQALWASARAFSDAEAYPERRFPVTDPGTVCVLCQQELTPVAADRLNRFEAFVRDDSQQRAAAARVAYDRALATFKGEAVSLTELANIVATVRDELRQDALAMEIRGATLRALWRHRQIRRRHANPAAALGAPVVPYPRQALTDQVADVQFKGDDKLKTAFPAETTSKIMVFATNGRFYTLDAGKIPGGRGHGEPIRLMVEIEAGHEIVVVFPYAEGQKFLVASHAGKGFVVKVEDALATTRKGKQVLNVKAPDKAVVVAPAGGDHVAVIGENRKMVIFPLSDVPEMGRGRGVILQRFKDGGLEDARVFALAEGLPDANDRVWPKPELKDWMGARGQAGRLPPRGFPKSGRFNAR